MPQLRLDDTIAAVSTPSGEGGIAVIRLSGGEAISLAARFFRSSSEKERRGALQYAPTHTVHHGRWFEGDGMMVDEVLVSLFRKPHSYTGEDVIEISCHGGTLLAKKIIELLVKGGARHAEPGEFTKRAFLNGKIDLTQAEAVLDLIRAKSDASLRAAIHQLQGNLSKKINGLKEKLMKIYAHLEASLDFPDERIETYTQEELSKELQIVVEEIETLIGSFKRGELVREGILTVIVGRPNVGKSSLLNALLQKDRALVSYLPGTTRDALEETVQIGQMAVRLVDTAGLSLVPKGELDQMGMERTLKYLEEGHLFLFLVDGSSKWTPEDQDIASKLQGKNFLLVINKIDLPQGLGRETLAQNFSNVRPCFISCLEEKGLLELEKQIEEKIHEMGIVQESMALTRLRHKQAFERSLGGIRRCQEFLEKGESTEFILIDLKTAIDALAELIGEVYSEDLLDFIFQEFCIGK